jgi:hypothetical protein
MKNLIDRIKKFFTRKDPLYNVPWRQVSPWKFVFRNYILRIYIIYFNRNENFYTKKKIVLSLSDGIIDRELYTRYIDYIEDYSETEKSFQKVKKILKKFGIEVKIG